jgi:hypothetical protein
MHSTPCFAHVKHFLLFFLTFFVDSRNVLRKFIGMKQKTREEERADNLRRLLRLEARKINALDLNQRLNRIELVATLWPDIFMSYLAEAGICNVTWGRWANRKTTPHNRLLKALEAAVSKHPHEIA